jgi:hypothetical protein
VMRTFFTFASFASHLLCHALADLIRTEFRGYFCVDH